MDVQAAHFSAIERAGAATAENGELVAGLVDGAVAVDTFRNGEGGAARMGGGNELGSGARAEAGEKGSGVPRGKLLENAQSLLALADEGESTPGNHVDFYIVDFISCGLC